MARISSRPTTILRSKVTLPECTTTQRGRLACSRATRSRGSHSRDAAGCAPAGPSAGLAPHVLRPLTCTKAAGLAHFEVRRLAARHKLSRNANRAGRGLPVDRPLGTPISGWRIHTVPSTHSRNRTGPHTNPPKPITNDDSPQQAMLLSFLRTIRQRSR
jgi:hypothetical protein